MPRKRISGALAAAIAAAIALTCWSAKAEPIEDFYRGKTMRMLIGYGPGGGYDIYGRLVAEFLPKHLPGHPTIVPQNMPGASGLTAANYLYRVAPKDGSVLGVIHPNSAFAQVIGMKSIQYDARRFNWIGRLTSSNSVLYTWHTSPTRTPADLLARETLIGGIGPLTDGAIFSRMTNTVLGTRIKMIQGYKGTAAANLAMERGEIEGMFNIWEGMKSLNADWIRDRKIGLVVQFVTRRHPELPDVPAIIEMAQTDAQRDVIRLFLSTAEIGRHIMMPPDVPADRVAAVRQAFVDMLRDPEFLADAKRAHLELNSLDGEGLQKLNIDAFNAPASAVETAQKVMGE